MAKNQSAEARDNDLILDALAEVVNATASQLAKATGIPNGRLRVRLAALIEAGDAEGKKSGAGWVYWDMDGMPPAPKKSKAKAKKKSGRPERAETDKTAKKDPNNPSHFFPTATIERRMSFFSEGDLVWFKEGRHLAGKWVVLVLEISKGKRGSRFYAQSEDGKVYTVTGDTGHLHIPVRSWGKPIRDYDSKTGKYIEQPEPAAAKKLREVWQANADAGYTRANEIRNRISSRRAAGQLARAEGRRSWFWSEYGV